MTNRGTYLHLCFFSNVYNISVKLLMYMRTSCIPLYLIQFHPRLLRAGQAGSTHPIDKVFPGRWLGGFNDLV